MNIILIVAYLLSTSSGLVLLKLGSGSGAPVSIVNHALKFNLNPCVLSGVFFYVMSFVLYTYLISKYDLGFIVPLTTAIVYVLVFIASFIVFNEAFTLAKAIAIALIIIGVTILNLNR